METTKKSQIVGIKNAGIVIICCFIIAVCIYHFLLGNPSNFMNNDPNNHPLPGNFLGTIYKGGIIVPVIQTLLLTVLALSSFLINFCCKDTNFSYLENFKRLDTLRYSPCDFLSTKNHTVHTEYEK